MLLGWIFVWLFSHPWALALLCAAFFGALYGVVLLGSATIRHLRRPKEVSGVDTHSAEVEIPATVPDELLRRRNG